MKTPGFLRSLLRTAFVAAALLCAGWAQGATVVIKGPTTIQSGEHVRFYSYLRDGSGEKYVNVNWYVYVNGSLFRNYGKGYYIGFTMDSKQDVNLTIVGVHSSGATYRLAVVLKPWKLKSLTITGPSRIEAGGYGLYYCEALWGNGEKENVSASFTVSGNGGTAGPFEGYVYYENANPPRVGDVRYTIVATFRGMTARKTVTVEGYRIEELEILGPDSVHSNGEADYECIAIWEDGYYDYVTPTWSVVEGAAYGGIDGNGHFKAESTRQERTVAIQASYGGATSDPFPITITPKKIASLAVDTHGKSVYEAGETGRFSTRATFDDGTEGSVEGTWAMSSQNWTGPNVGPCPAISWTAPSPSRDTRYTVTVWCDDVDSCPFAETTVTVRAKGLKSVTIQGAGAVKSLAQDVPYRCVAEFTDGSTEIVEASWSIPSGGTYVTGTAMGDGGRAILLDFVSTLSQLDNAVTLRGSFSWNGRTESATIGITINHKTEQSLKINGPDRVAAGDSAGYTATVFYDDKTSATVSPQTWSVSPSVDSISGGTLYTKRTTTSREDTIAAVFTGAWMSVFDEKNVFVQGSGDNDDVYYDDYGEEGKLSYFYVYAEDLSIGAFDHTWFKARACFVSSRQKFWVDVTDKTTFDLSHPGLYQQYADVDRATGYCQAHNYTPYEHQVYVKGTFRYNGKKTNPYVRTESTGVVFIQPKIIPPTPQPPQPPQPPSATLSNLVVVGPSTVPSGGTAEYKCLGLYSDGTTAEVAPSWSLVYGIGDSITSKGQFLAGTAIQDRPARIRASFGGKTADKFITVLGRKLSSISISGPASVRAGGTAVYSCIAHYDDGTAEAVSASWATVAGVQYGSIDSSGTFRATETDDAGVVEIQASYRTRLALKTVTVVPPGSTPALVSVPVYRFYSKNYKGHFFTLDEDEKDTLINTNPNWHYEGIAYYAFGEKGEGMVTLHRFYSKKYRGHFFTIDEEEMRTVRDTNPNWKYEGTAYYVYPEKIGASVPVYRFWSKGYRHHFYTTDEEEMKTVRDTNPNWKYEGIAFYALPGEIVAPAGRTVESLSVSGPSSVSSGGTAALSCAAVFVDGSSEDVEPAWSVVSGSAYASIDAAGVLTARETDADRAVTVRAVWNGFTADFALVVEARVLVLEALAIDGESIVAAGDSTTLSCMAWYDDGSEESVSPAWRIVSGAGLGSISASGVFAAAAETAGGAVSIEAEWGGLTADWSIWVEGDVADGGPFAEIVDGLEWTYCVSNGTAWVGDLAGTGRTAVPSNTLGDVSIPTTLGGLPVAGVADWAFAGCQTITSMTVPEGVVRIGEGAFAYCSTLASISLPASLETLGDNAFLVTGSREISVSSSSSHFKSVGGVLFSKDGKTLICCPNVAGFSDDAAYAVPSGTETIAMGAFSMGAMVSISLPDGLKTIEPMAFLLCQRLRSISIPASTTSIAEDAFIRCSLLSSFSVVSGNPSYKSVDGVLFSKDGSRLVFFPPNHSKTSYEVPAGVSTLCDNAFFFCQGLESLTIPNDVTTMGYDALWGLTGLKSLTVPARFSVLVERSQLPDDCTVLYTGSAQNAACAMMDADWTLTAECGEGIVAVAVPGATELGDVLVEACADCPDASELAACRDTGVPPASALRLSLPPGVWSATLWSAASGPIADEEVEGGIEFILPATGAWHWLRVRDAADGEAGDAFSVWIRAE